MVADALFNMLMGNNGLNGNAFSALRPDLTQFEGPMGNAGFHTPALNFNAPWAINPVANMGMGMAAPLNNMLLGGYMNAPSQMANATTAAWMAAAGNNAQASQQNANRKMLGSLIDRIFGGSGGGGGLAGFRDMNSGATLGLPGANPSNMGFYGNPVTAQAPSRANVMAAGQRIGQGPLRIPTPATNFPMNPGAVGELNQMAGDAARMTNQANRTSMLSSMLPAQSQLNRSINRMRTGTGQGMMGALAGLGADRQQQQLTMGTPFIRALARGLT